MQTILLALIWIWREMFLKKTCGCHNGWLTSSKSVVIESMESYSGLLFNLGADFIDLFILGL